MSTVGWQTYASNKFEIHIRNSQKEITMNSEDRI